MNPCNFNALEDRGLVYDFLLRGDADVEVNLDFATEATWDSNLFIIVFNIACGVLGVNIFNELIQCVLLQVGLQIVCGVIDHSLD